MPPTNTLRLFRVARRVQRIALTGDYDGAWAEMVMNPGSGVIDAIQAEMVRYLEAEDKSRIASGPVFRRQLAACLQAWNVADADGLAVPPTEAGLESVEWGLLNNLLAEWMAARALPEASAVGSTNGSAASAPTPLAGSSRRSTAGG